MELGNFSEKDQAVIKKSYNSVNTSINQCLNLAKNLYNNLVMLKSCYKDYGEVEIDMLNIATSYANVKEAPLYNLPGVVNPPAQYNIEQMKKDQATMEELAAQKQKVDTQKETYMNICKEDARLLSAALKTLNYSDLYLSNILLSLNTEVNKNY